MKRILKILVACEESQAVCKEFRRLGHIAFSCDLQECSGGHPEWHFHQDVIEIIKNGGGHLQSGEEYYIDGNWDLMVAHTPCTYLAVSGAQWYYHPEDKHLPIEQRRPHPKFPNRAKDREDGAAFFMALANAPIEHIAIENPVGIMSRRFRKPNQIVQPYMFGDPYSKRTLLWLNGLPELKPTNVLEDFVPYLPSNTGGFSRGKGGSRGVVHNAKDASKTFPGIAKAMAEQWG